MNTVMNPTPAPAWHPWELVLGGPMYDYHRRLQWWLFSGVWIAIGNVMAIQRGWQRKWPWLPMPQVCR